MSERPKHPALTAVDILQPGANEKIAELGRQARLLDTPLNEVEQTTIKNYVDQGQSFDDIMMRVKPEHLGRVGEFLKHLGQEAETGNNYIERLR